MTSEQLKDIVNAAVSVVTGQKPHISKKSRPCNSKEVWSLFCYEVTGCRMWALMSGRYGKTLRLTWIFPDGRRLRIVDHTRGDATLLIGDERLLVEGRLLGLF